MPYCAYYSLVFSGGVRSPVLAPPDIAGGSCEWADGLMFTRDEYAQFTARTQSVDERLTALEQASSSVNELPPPDQIAAAWGVGFTTVVGCYVIARMVGAVVNFLK